jgi:hypothetical protein
MLGAAFSGQLRHVDPVGPRQAQQHVGGERALVALQQSHIGGGNVQVGGHRRLRQPQVAPQPAQARAHIDGTVSRHDCSPL